MTPGFNVLIIGQDGVSEAGRAGGGEGLVTALGRLLYGVSLVLRDMANNILQLLAYIRFFIITSMVQYWVIYIFDYTLCLSLRFSLRISTCLIPRQGKAMKEAR